MSGWAAAAGVASGLLSTAGSIWAAREAWKHQKEAMQNAHQWEVADLRKAGLNPILSATGGSGASTGGLNTPMPDMSGLERGFSSALQGLMVDRDLKQKDASIENTEANTDAANATAHNQNQQAAAATQAAAVHYENARKAQMMNDWWKNNPKEFGQYMVQQGLPAFGGLAAAGYSTAKGVFNHVQKLSHQLGGGRVASSDPRSSDWNGGD